MRISVVGASGSGKTTFGRTLAEKIGAPFVELDSIYHQADWQALPDDEFRARVREAVAVDRWVIDGNYSAVRPIVLGRATNVVWLDFERRLVMARVLRRSIERAVTHRELWNGNRERVREWLDPEHPIRWSWSQHGRKRRDYEERFAAPQYAHLEVQRFTTPRDAQRWLDSLR